MKKIIAVFFSMVFVFMLFGCGANEVYNLAKSQIAEVRYNLFEAKNSEMNVTLMCGKRERDYVINGYCTEPIDFGVLTFRFLNAEASLVGNAQYVLIIGTNRYTGDLEKNPFDDSYVADVKKVATPNSIIKAKIMLGKFSMELELKSVSGNWNINHEDALKLACKHLKKDLNNLIEEKQFLGEVYIKIINSELMTDGGYYWYVNFIGRKGQNLAVIIDPNSNEILATKVSV